MTTKANDMTKTEATQAIAKEFGSQIDDFDNVVVMRCVNRNFRKREAKVRKFADGLGFEVGTFEYSTNRLGVMVL